MMTSVPLSFFNIELGPCMTRNTIVFIDDDPDWKTQASRASGRLDCECLFFERATDVIDSIDAINPKLIVLDLAMVNLDGVYCHNAGIEISATLRKTFGDRFPILVLTGTENPELICECLQNGADDYFVKGDRITGLVKRIAAWLVVDYAAANPRQEREATASALEILVAKHGNGAVRDWRKIVMAAISRRDAAPLGSLSTSRALGDLFAWQSGLSHT